MQRYCCGQLLGRAGERRPGVCGEEIGGGREGYRGVVGAGVRWEGRGGVYSFVAGLRRLIIDDASLQDGAGGGWGGVLMSCIVVVV